MNARLTLIATAAFAIILSSCAPGAGTADAAQSPQADDEPGWRWSDERVFATVNAVRAGRDLTPASWPGGARAAVLLSFDVDNETIPIRNGQPTIGGLSQGEYGARRALPRIIEILDEHDIPASFFIPAMSLQFNPEMLDAIQAAGHHEIGIHGWIHETNSLLEADEERALLERAVAYLTEVTGERPVGYRAPSWNFSPNTLDIILDMDFLYDSSLMADDRPYEIVANGEPTGLIELPVEWILDDAPPPQPARKQLQLSPRRPPGLHRRVRPRLGGGHHAGAHHAPALHRPSLPHPHPGRPHRAHQRPRERVVRDASRGGGICAG